MAETVPAVETWRFFPRDLGWFAKLDLEERIARALPQDARVAAAGQAAYRRRATDETTSWHPVIYVLTEDTLYLFNAKTLRNYAPLATVAIIPLTNGFWVPPAFVGRAQVALWLLDGSTVELTCNTVADSDLLYPELRKRVLRATFGHGTARPQIVTGFTRPVYMQATFLGGHGTSIKPGAPAVAAFLPDQMTLISAQQPPSQIPYPELLTLSVGGPGAYTTGGGWIGGGFGVEGAAEGALIASVLNRLTTKRHVKTVLRVTAQGVEWNLSTGTDVPEDVEIQLSPIRGYLLERLARPPAPRDGEGVEMQKSAFCTNCGQRFAAEARFCGACGSAR